MLHIVELRHIGHDLSASADELRNWLDAHGIQPIEFQHSVGGPGITFRIRFLEESEARAFAETFHGWLNNGMQPTETARWAIADPCSRTEGAADR